MSAQVQLGEVLSFDRDLARGVVKLGGRQLSLGPTYFHLRRTARTPKAGDLVDVVVSDRTGGVPNVVYVRLSVGASLKQRSSQGEHG